MVRGQAQLTSLTFQQDQLFEVQKRIGQKGFLLQRLQPGLRRPITDTASRRNRLQAGQVLPAVRVPVAKGLHEIGNRHSQRFDLVVCFF